MLFLKGMLLDLSIAAPVGPIGLWCMRQTLRYGKRYGFVSGLGAAAADAAYGLTAALGLSIVTQFLLRHSAWIQLTGAMFIIYLAYKTLKSPVQTDCSDGPAKHASLPQAFLTTFFLTLTNPMTILSFIAIFAGMGAGWAGQSPLLLVVGVFAGSAVWWLLLAYLVGWLRERLNAKLMRSIQIGAGLVLFGFGAYSLLNVISPL
ncbi:LysE family translocator [Paenibacillus nanensis]|uniref:LysE family translocator n=1 Tax=Paenibacillus nanensis TaxID=393251 RepID=A0A3A1UN72_9BACL|nr:LysE family transporter [Paenibacillus nanensis]RIX49989.1 LysE family translocator [Paenibacillus nanensis]